jgi:hypothetical protein
MYTVLSKDMLVRARQRRMFTCLGRRTTIIMVVTTTTHTGNIIMVTSIQARTLMGTQAPIVTRIFILKMNRPRILNRRFRNLSSVPVAAKSSIMMRWFTASSRAY